MGVNEDEIRELIENGLAVRQIKIVLNAHLKKFGALLYVTSEGHVIASGLDKPKTYPTLVAAFNAALQLIEEKAGHVKVTPSDELAKQLGAPDKQLTLMTDLEHAYDANSPLITWVADGACTSFAINDLHPPARRVVAVINGAVLHKDVRIENNLLIFSYVPVAGTRIYLYPAVQVW